MSLPWERFHTEVLFKSVRSGQQFSRGIATTSLPKWGANKRPFRAPTFSSPFPVRFCFRFDRGQHCEGLCGFKHECPKCHGNHAPDRCGDRSQSSQPKFIGRGAFSKSTLPALGRQQLLSKHPLGGHKGGAGVGRGQHTPGQTYNSSK